MDRRQIILGSLFYGCKSITGHAADLALVGDVFLEVLASPPGTFPVGQNWLTPGHAFVCISYHLSSGIKEDCFGFYPASSGNEAVIGGDSLNDEFQKNPDRFSNVSWSLKKKLGSTQRQSFFQIVNDANSRTFSLTKYNCGDFVFDAVQAIGWSNVSKGLLPEPYVRDLVVVNTKRYKYLLNGSFHRLERSNANWLQLNENGRVSNTYVDRGHDGTHIMMDDGPRNVVEIRVPIKGGIAKERLYRRGTWHDYQANPLNPEYD